MSARLFLIEYSDGFPDNTGRVDVHVIGMSPVPYGELCANWDEAVTAADRMRREYLDGICMQCKRQMVRQAMHTTCKECRGLGMLAP